MTVDELVTFLQTVPRDYVVIMSCDEEGNSFSPLAELAICEYVPDTKWYGDIRDEDWYEDMEDEDLEEEYEPNAVVLWPVN
jgi:hypothetical protein